MPRIESLILDAADPAAATAFYAAALGPNPPVRVRRAQEQTSGFRGFTLSLVVSQPSVVDLFVGTFLDAGATEIKPVAKSLWGYGGVVQAPDGALWKVASSSKEDSGPAERTVDELVLLVGAGDVKASKRFYVEHGLSVKRSFGAKYCEFDSDGPIKLALYGRKALAKDAGVDPDGTGTRGLAITGAGQTATDPDGVTWEQTGVSQAA